LLKVFERNGEVLPGAADLAQPGLVGMDFTSNNAGELQAFIEMAAWILLESHTYAHGVASIEWVYDSKWAFNVATGSWQARVHPAAVLLAQCLAAELAQRFSVFEQWCKGHSSERWNDEVDVLAKDGALRKILTHFDATRRVSVVELLQACSFDHSDFTQRLGRTLAGFDVATPLLCTCGSSLQPFRTPVPRYRCDVCYAFVGKGVDFFKCAARGPVGACDFHTCVECTLSSV